MTIICFSRVQGRIHSFSLVGANLTSYHKVITYIDSSKDDAVCLLETDCLIIWLTFLFV